MGTQSLEEGYCWIGLLSTPLGCVIKSLMRVLEKTGTSNYEREALFLWRRSIAGVMLLKVGRNEEERASLLHLCSFLLAPPNGETLIPTCDVQGSRLSVTELSVEGCAET